MAIAACVSQEGGADANQLPRGVTPARYYCAVLCRRLSECRGSGFSRVICENNCADSAYPDSTADDVLTRTANCYARQSCAVFADESVYTLCYDEAVLDLQPSEQCAEFCLQDTAAAFECGGGYSLDGCLSEGVCSWSDRVLADATECIGLDCEARVMCQTAVFVIPE